MHELTFNDIEKSSQRIKNFVTNTGVINNAILDKKIGAQVFFKMENAQKTMSFKARGAFNAVLAYKEKHGCFPQKIVAQSSGNHAQAIAYVCKLFGIEALIYMAGIVPSHKIQATRGFGAEVILCEKRAQANAAALEKVAQGYVFIHPSDNDDVIAGQGTSAFEALSEIGEVAAIFAPCGGGGLVAGCYLAAQGLSRNAKTYACEPLNANDAARSVREGKIFAFPDSPNTIADGARTLAVAPRCFHYLKKLNGILEISEAEIIFWQKEFLEATGILIEPTSALAVAGAAKYFINGSGGEKALVVISGGNAK